MGVDDSRASRRAGRGELAIVGAAAGLLCAHILDDSFVALEPGTARREHLSAALVPIAFLAVGLLVYRHARPGHRAALALTCGCLALVGGGLALAHALGSGLSGDDWSGLPLLVAGSVLVGLGTVTAFRSRHRRGRWVLRRSLVALGAVVVAYELVLPVALALVATHRPREHTRTVAVSSRAHEAVSIATRDGLVLRGWYVPSLNGAAILAFPGRRSPISHARLLARHGYGVLLLDMRGQGESDGDPNTFGWSSVADVEAAVSFLRSRPDVEPKRIGGLGLSVGGEAMIEAAATNTALRAVVSEGAGERSVRESSLRGLAGLPSLPFAMTLTAATAILSGDAPPPSLQSRVGQIAPRPLLLIYAGHGGGGEDLNPAYYAAAREPKEVWEIPEASHIGGLRARPAAYEQRVVGFFDRALLDRD